MSVPSFSLSPAKYLFQGRAGRPANTNPWVKLAFYNIGWNPASKKARHTMEGLAIEIDSMVRDKGVHAVGICEVFNLKDAIGDETQQQCCTACVDRTIRWPLHISLEVKQTCADKICICQLRSGRPCLENGSILSVPSCRIAK
jgi:hypothetical protein